MSTIAVTLLLSARVLIPSSAPEVAGTELPTALSGHNVMVEGAPAYLSMAANAQTGGPSVVVVAGDWGLNDGIRLMADRFAEAGMTALAVDLYDGKVPETAADARSLVKAVVPAEAASMIAKAVSFLREHPQVKAGKLGIIGGGSGGRWAMQAASATRDFSAVVLYDFSASKKALRKMTTPLLTLSGVSADDSAAARLTRARMVAFLEARLGATEERQPVSTWSAPFGVQGASQVERKKAATARRANRGD